MPKQIKVKEIDADRLKKFITGQGMTLTDFSYSIGKSASYISNMSGAKRIYENVVCLICEKLGVDPDYFDYAEKKETENTGELLEAVKQLQGDIAALTGLVKDVLGWQKSTLHAVQELQKGLSAERADNGKALSALAESTEVIRKKVCANTVQLEKLKDSIRDISATDYNRAKQFLLEAMEGGKVEGTVLLAKADAACIKRSEVMKAKKELGIEVRTTGYGKNQTAWWVMGDYRQ